MPKLTREMKLKLNEEVTGETKRCLAIVQRVMKDRGDDYDSKQRYNHLAFSMIKTIVEESPYIEFHPELLKRIPK